MVTISGSDPFNFGTVAAGARVSQRFTLTNSGNGEATELLGTLNEPFRFLGGVFPGTGGDCANTLASLSSCQVVVEFAPNSIAANADTLEVVYNNGVSVTNSVRSLNGESVAPAQISVGDLPVFDFGSIDVGDAIRETFVVTNLGGFIATDIQISSLQIPFSYEGGFFPGMSGDCTVSLAPGASCRLVVQFEPISVGPNSETLNVLYSDGARRQSVSIDIEGSGLLSQPLRVSTIDL